MPELLRDWLTGRTVLLAENRAERPNEFAATLLEFEAAASAAAADCPFCLGHESVTPPAVYEHVGDDGAWNVRVVPNLFPAVALEVDSPTTTSPAIGVHEVVIESARHIDHMSALSVEELADVLQAYAARLNHWRETGQFEYGLVFKNSGVAAGASLVHIHSQLVATPELPPTVAAEFSRAEQLYRDQGDCPYCLWINEERAANERVVFERDGFLVFCPHVSLQAHETWLVPTKHEPWFERPADADAIDRLAAVLHDVLVRIETVAPANSYNVLLRTAPWRESAQQCGHWRIEILPRSGPIAGLELATGVYINLLSPSRAAEQLRTQ